MEMLPMRMTPHRVRTLASAVCLSICLFGCAIVCGEAQPSRAPTAARATSKPAAPWRALADYPRPPAPDTGWGNSSGQGTRSDYLDLVQTGADGRYAFAAVPINDPTQVTDRYKIVVEADGFQPNSKGTRLEVKNEVDTVDFVLVPMGGIIFGSITTPGNEAISQARIELRKRYEDTTGAISTKFEETIDWVESGSEGAYSFADLEPGTYSLKFSRTGCRLWLP